MNQKRDVKKMKKEELVNELKNNNLPSKGKVNSLRSRLQKFYDSVATNASNLTANQSDSLSEIDKKIQEKEEELLALRRQAEANRQNSEKKRSSQKENDEQTSSEEEAAFARNKREQTRRQNQTRNVVAATNQMNGHTAAMMVKRYLDEASMDTRHTDTAAQQTSTPTNGMLVRTIQFND